MTDALSQAANEIDQLLTEIARLKRINDNLLDLLTEIDGQLGDLPPWSLRLKTALAKAKGGA